MPLPIAEDDPLIAAARAAAGRAYARYSHFRVGPDFPVLIDRVGEFRFAELFPNPFVLPGDRA